MCIVVCVFAHGGVCLRCVFACDFEFACVCDHVSVCNLFQHWNIVPFPTRTSHYELQCECAHEFPSREIRLSEDIGEQRKAA
jgi:hypothetical protein